jgi:flagellar hook-associated protein 2
LSQIGVSFQKDGTMAVDSAKLQSVIGTNFNDIASLFAATGKASDSLASYTGATANTKPGAYALTVSQLATQGNVLGSGAAGLTIDGTNDSLSVTVDGVTATVTLAAGTYTAAALATEVQSKINGASVFSGAGISVAVTQASGTMNLTSNRYGSASSVSVAGIGAANLLGVAPTSTPGVDVAGTINGVAATGSGQALTGSSGNAAEGLKVLVNGGVLGSRGTVNYSQGYAYKLDKQADSLLSSTGPISSRTDGINQTIKDIGDRREVLNRRMATIEKRYRAQFTALDTLISSMTKTSNFLSQQLASIPK